MYFSKLQSPDQLPRLKQKIYAPQGGAFYSEECSRGLGNFKSWQRWKSMSPLFPEVGGVGVTIDCCITGMKCSYGKISSPLTEMSVGKTEGAIHSTKIPTGPTGKSGPPQKVDPFFRNFSGWTEPIHWVLDRNFRKFWLNGSRPEISGTEPARPLIWTYRNFYKGFRGKARSRKPGSYEEALRHSWWWQLEQIYFNTGCKKNSKRNETELTSLLTATTMKMNPKYCKPSP